MLRLLVVLALAACHHPAVQPAVMVGCPGPYAIVAGACTAAPPAACRGLCGVVVRTDGCVPLDATVIVQSLNLVVATDKAGQFDIGPIPAGHYKIQVTAQQDTGSLEVDATGSPQPLTSPLELRLADRVCGCGGVCPT